MNFLAFDLETTGLDVSQDRIIEIAIKRWDGPESFGVPNGCVWRVNPGRPIPPAATAVHGITDVDVANCPPFAAIAETVKAALEGQTVVGYGINRFDIAILCEEMIRAKVPFDFHSVTWIDVGELYKQLAPRTLSAAVKEFLDRDHAGAHGAGPDAAATAEVFETMLRRFPGKLAGSTAELALMSRYGQPLADPAGKLTYIDGRLCYAFGKYKGVQVLDEIGYARWMLDRDFPEATKQVLEAELNREAEADVASAMPGQSSIPF